ncbi:hypothetical protein [Azotobacter armeniacus]
MKAESAAAIAGLHGDFVESADDAAGLVFQTIVNLPLPLRVSRQTVHCRAIA